jgi:cysteine desulfurase
LKPPVYLDHHATTPVDPRVLDAMLPYFGEEYGNAASATHAYGWRAEAAVELAREQIAEAIGARDPREIVFTSGATESDNLALKGIAWARGGGHLVISAVEHPAVADSAAALARRGCSLTVVPVDVAGRVDPGDVAAALRDDTRLVSVLWANGEVGTVQDVGALAGVCRENGVPFHSDAAQAVGKVPVDVADVGADLLSLSAHKVYGPKGVGALYVRRGRPRLELEPLFHGGGQEGGRRSGSLPVPLIVGFARALAIAAEERAAEASRLAGLRERFCVGLEARVPGVRTNGPPVEQRLPGNLHVSIVGVPADALVAAVPEVALSTGSACSSGTGEPSPVLRALGLPDERVREGFRIGFGRFNTEAEIDLAVGAVAQAALRIREERRASASPGSRGAAKLPPSSSSGR